jgi:hypothetical protein
MIDKIRKTKNQARTLAKACVTLVRRNDVSLWHKVAHGGPPSWDKRNEIIGKMVEPKSSVLDVGCGAQTLKNYLPPGCKYQPADLIKSSPEVIVCDLNGGVYPDNGEYYDYVICSGVLEYMRDPEDFLRRIPKLGRTVILTYNPLADNGSKIDRLGNGWGWVNHFKRGELEELFSKMGLKWTVQHVDKLQYVIYSLTLDAKSQPTRTKTKA